MGLWSPVDVGRLKLPHTPEFKVAWKEGRKELFYPDGKTYVQTIGEQD